MIDEKRLAHDEQGIRQLGYNLSLGRDDGLEIIRLARLGLWAEAHAIRALKTWRHDDSGLGACPLAYSSVGRCNCGASAAADALDALNAVGGQV